MSERSSIEGGRGMKEEAMTSDNPRCADCHHERSLHWRPACNAVGCRCTTFRRGAPHE